MKFEMQGREGKVEMKNEIKEKRERRQNATFNQ
jgi:hypothetical protein